MTDKIRKRLRPVSVVATIAVLGLLAAFIALAALPDITSAQDPPPPPPPPTQGGGNGGPPAPPAPPAPAAQPLPAPTEVMADASVSQELTVTWMSVTGASSYRVDYNKLASATDYQLAAIVGPNATSYTIMNLDLQ